MGRSLVLLAVLFAGLAALPARAQGSAPDALFGLPLVVREGGWARYVNTSPDGPTQFVIKLGGSGRHEGKRGRWVVLELDVPATGRLGFDFLVEGERFSAKSVLLMRLRVPGRPPSDTPAPFNRPGADRQPHVLREGTETVAGKKLKVTEYSYAGGITAQWSPAVPVLGLVRVSGTQSFQLESFGVGGDPWKDATAAGR
ncbi:hypothetical protein [Corallococcus aberystwythensis]|uniref:DUF3047 domain-containing protein n=1 Tax=Corallococcus aberystwythensis TaxID=2316722 RepID=A0A3A8QH55_9BACT|nr:hypothetical protein [Corallococcus aberystwythensis]RKH66240.1 hypothetical protein D7W81_15780 [Corallococcus aberystwythensis]